MSRDRRPEAGPTSDQRPEQTENDEQSTPTSADEYGSLTVEDNPGGTVDRRPGRHGRGVRRRGGLPAGVPSRTSRAEPLLDLSAGLVARRAPLAVGAARSFRCCRAAEGGARKGTNIEAVGDENADTAETARRDLDRIFNTGGVAALVGNTYGAAKDVGVYYVTGEAIRGLADLEAKERERCANFATKAVAAGVAERTVRVAERQGQLMVKMAQAALREVDLSPEQASAFKAALARQAGELTAPS
jgi:hypothetical protein